MSALPSAGRLPRSRYVSWCPSWRRRKQCSASMLGEWVCSTSSRGSLLDFEAEEAAGFVYHSPVNVDLIDLFKDLAQQSFDLVAPFFVVFFHDIPPVTQQGNAVTKRSQYP